MDIIKAIAGDTGENLGALAFGQSGTAYVVSGALGKQCQDALYQAYAYRHDDGEGEEIGDVSTEEEKTVSTETIVQDQAKMVDDWFLAKSRVEQAQGNDLVNVGAIHAIHKRHAGWKDVNGFTRAVANMTEAEKSASALIILDQEPSMTFSQTLQDHNNGTVVKISSDNPVVEALESFCRQNGIPVYTSVLALMRNHFQGE